MISDSSRRLMCNNDIEWHEKETGNAQRQMDDNC